MGKQKKFFTKNIILHTIPFSLSHKKTFSVIDFIDYTKPISNSLDTVDLFIRFPMLTVPHYLYFYIM